MILVTGAAGFIGMHVTITAIAEGAHVIGVDNLNEYYDVKLKKDRLNLITKSVGAKHFTFEKGDISDAAFVERLFLKYKFNAIIHLAAQAGVRYSIEEPHIYIASNVTGFLNIQEAIRRVCPGAHLIYASSSSVYGTNKKVPFSEDDRVDSPASLYAVTKRTNELMAHSYAKLFGLRSTGLRLFTVYGPWARPDMAFYTFTRCIFERRPIPLFNSGKMQRDFTYIEDVVKAIIRILNQSSDSFDGYYSELDGKSANSRVLNIGNGAPTNLTEVVRLIGELLDISPIIDNQPMQLGDVPITYADASKIQAIGGPVVATPLEEGLKPYLRWFQQYYKLS